MVAAYLRKTAIFVRDLLDIDEQLIRIGRINFELEDMSSPYIGIDALGGSRHLAKSEKYDGEAEEMTYVSRYSAPVTISFSSSASTLPFSMYRLPSMVPFLAVSL